MSLSSTRRTPPTSRLSAMAALEGRLNPGARIYVEAPIAGQALPGPWTRLREGTAGAVKFALYEFASQAGDAAAQEDDR